MRYVLVTVCSPEFFLGTKVLIQSFLKENSWYEGEIIVINDGLTSYQKNELEERFNVSFVEIGAGLNDKITHLIKVFPHFHHFKSRFYSLECFSFQNYDKILFCDSDLLCTGDIRRLYENEENFSAAWDYRKIMGYVRHQDSFMFSKPEFVPEKFKEFFISGLFNTGVMAIGATLVKQNAYQRILDELIPETYEKIKTGHTDTVVLNKLFLDQVTWLDQNYNTYWPITSNMATVEGFIHFIGKQKPWSANIDHKNKWVRKWWEYANE